MSDSSPPNVRFPTMSLCKLSCATPSISVNLWVHCTPADVPTSVLKLHCDLQVRWNQNQVPPDLVYVCILLLSGNDRLS